MVNDISKIFSFSRSLNNHHNPLVTQLLDTTDQIRRLERKYSLD